MSLLARRRASGRPDPTAILLGRPRPHRRDHGRRLPLHRRLDHRRLDRARRRRRRGNPTCRSRRHRRRGSRRVSRVRRHDRDGGRNSTPSTGPSPSPNRRSGNLVARKGGILVENNARICVRIPDIEIELLIRHRRPVATDLKLQTRRIKLRAPSAIVLERHITLMMRDNLLAHQIPPGRQRARKHDVVLPAVRNQPIHSPFPAREPVLGDLGPDGPGAVAGRRGQRRDVCDDGALVGRVDDVVALAVVLPLEGKGVAGGGEDEGRGGGAAVEVAREGGRGEVFDGGVGGRGADVGVEAGALGYAVDGDAVDGGVGGDGGGEGGEGQGEGGGEMHGCGLGVGGIVWREVGWWLGWCF